jgi:GT2 family glycosyltransferase
MPEKSNISSFEHPAVPIHLSDLAEIAFRRRHRVETFLSNFELYQGVQKKNNIIFLRIVLRLHVFLKSRPQLKYFARRVLQLSPLFIRTRIFDIISQTSNFRFTNVVATKTSSQFLDYQLTNSDFGLSTSLEAEVTILIPFFDKPELTLKCLRKLQENDDQTIYDVVLIDDGSSDETREILRGVRGVRYLQISRNIGYLEAMNLAMNFSRTRYSVFLNNDCQPMNGWLDELIRISRKKNDQALVGSFLFFPDGTLQEAGSQVFTDGSAINIGHKQKYEQERYSFLREVDYCSFASALIPTKIWHELGGFDNRYAPAYYEDVDFCLKAWGAGYQIYAAPQSRVVHSLSQSYNADSKKEEIQAHSKSQLLKKWDFEKLPIWSSDAGNRIESPRESMGIVIIIDGVLPDSKRDAGSSRTLAIITIIQSLGYHVILSALNPMTSVLQIKMLQDSGVEVYFQPSELLTRVEDRAERIQFFWLTRAHIIENFEAACRKISPKANVIYDFLDLTYQEIDEQIEIDFLDAAVINSSKDVIVLCSPYEVQLALNLNKGASVESLFMPVIPQKSENNFVERRGMLFVGGFGHTPNLTSMNWFISEVLPILRKEGFTDEINIVGGGLPSSEKSRFESLGMVVHGKVDDLGPLYAGNRISIAPLTIGRGLKGKILEALSVGLPVVTTPIGAEGFPISDDSPFLIANSAEDFAMSILNLYSNQELWESKQDKGFQFLRNNYSNQEILSKMKRILALSSNRVDLNSEFSIINPQFSLGGKKIRLTHLSFFRLRLHQKMYKPILEAYQQVEVNKTEKFETLRRPSKLESFNFKVDSSFRGEIATSQFKKSPKKSELNGIFVSGDQKSIYGHWLIDTLPEYFYLKHRLNIDIQFLYTQEIPEFVTELFELFEIPISELVSLNTLVKDTHFRLFKTNTIRDFDFYDFDNFRKHSATKFELAKSRALESSQCVTFDKIFISRARLPKWGINSRSCENRAGLEGLFKSRGFQVIYPELLPIKDQIRLFASAKLIAGEAGSGLHNSLFSTQGAQILNIQSARQEHLIQASLGALRNQRTYYFWGEKITDDWNSNFRVDLEKMDTFLEKLELP